jgi:hypothetical protein
MAPEADPVELVGYEPDERLLGDDLAQLPPSVGRPEELPPSRARRRVVGVGATLTGVTLVAGIGLIALGIVEAVSGAVVLAVLAFAVGLGLIATHWGWVHVAELSANALENRRNSSLLEDRRLWLAAIQPYTRWEVTTHVGEDGSITIETVRHRPIRCGEDRFTFVREIEAKEVHSSEEPAAAVTERAELLRREAAARTTLAREGFEVAHDAYERTLMARDDEQQRQAALRAASEALSERINSNLRDPPLTE